MQNPEDVKQAEKIELLVFTKGKAFIYVPELVKNLAEHDCQVRDSQFMFLSEDDVRRHYAHVVNSDFFPGMLKLYAEHPVFIMKVYGTIEDVKSVVGKKTNPLACETMSFRAQYGNDMTDNAAHRSGDQNDAALEIERFFGPKGIVTLFRQNPEAQLEFFDKMVEYAQNVAWISAAWCLSFWGMDYPISLFLIKNILILIIFFRLI